MAKCFGTIYCAWFNPSFCIPAFRETKRPFPCDSGFVLQPIKPGHFVGLHVRRGRWVSKGMAGCTRGRRWGYFGLLSTTNFFSVLRVKVIAWHVGERMACCWTLFLNRNTAPPSRMHPVQRSPSKVLRHVKGEQLQQCGVLDIHDDEVKASTPDSFNREGDFRSTHRRLRCSANSAFSSLGSIHTEGSLYFPKRPRTMNHEQESGLCSRVHIGFCAQMYDKICSILVNREDSPNGMLQRRIRLVAVVVTQITHIWLKQANGPFILCQSWNSAVGFFADQTERHCMNRDGDRSVPLLVHCAIRCKCSCKHV